MTLQGLGMRCNGWNWCLLHLQSGPLLMHLRTQCKLAQVLESLLPTSETGRKLLAPGSSLVQPQRVEDV